ncbi:MAG: hypothetical protein WD993_07645 [Thermoleophilaceae bacterium]
MPLGMALALATPGRGGDGLLPARLAEVNGAYAPPWGLTLLLAAALVLLIAFGADEQVLVQFYAVAVFASFLGATAARRCCRAASAAGCRSRSRSPAPRSSPASSR